MKYLRNISVAMILMGMILFSCKKESDTIPLVEVNLVIYPNDPQYINLQIVSGWEYITGGSRGLLVYRYGQDEFRAYDRHCTYNPLDECGKVEVDSSNIIVTDLCCGSEFSIIDGIVIKEPAVVPLKQYQTTFDGNALRIFN